jgi:hypothetical protein
MRAKNARENVGEIDPSEEEKKENLCDLVNKYFLICQKKEETTKNKSQTVFLTIAVLFALKNK